MTSVEVDPSVAAQARDALHRTGQRPTLAVADGLAGYPEGAPYDRLIATCSVRRVPSAWLEQVRRGGRILVTVTGWLFAFALARLTVRPDGTADGSFLTSDVSFMIARSQEPPGNMHIPAPDEGVESGSSVAPDVFDGWKSRWVVQCAVPWAQHARMSVYGEPLADYLVDARSGAFAVVRKGRDGVVLVRQGGPERLWNTRCRPGGVATNPMYKRSV
ncbi:MAG: hypothetical protein ACRDPK_06135 [Carbonactinosporaceae bacterium]